MSRSPDGGLPADGSGSPRAPEIELLLACTSVGPDTGDASRIERLVAAGPDWIRFLQVGGRHGVLPLAHDRLQRWSSEEGWTGGVPGPVLDALRNRYYATARANLRLTLRLTELTTRLAEAGVGVVALKGPVLASTVYDNLAHREFGDLDLLVRRADLDRAAEILADAGLESLDELRSGQDPAFRAAWYAYCWRDPATQTLVELHWRLAPRYFPLGLDPDRIWRETEEITVHDRPVRSFAPEMLLLTLCVHGAKHEPNAWGRLKWILDVARVIAVRSDLDWDRLAGLATEAGCRRILHVGLRLASSLLGAAPPSRIMDGVEADAAARDLASRLENRLFVEAPQSTPVDRLRFELHVRERRRDRIRVLLGRALVPDTRDLSSVRLPRWLYPLYVPWRLLRLAGVALRHPGSLRHLVRPMKRKPPMVRV